MDKIIQKSKEVPGPNKYTKVTDWKAESHSGKFTKDKRKTYVDEILKLKKQVGPGSYNNSSKDKICGNYKK